MRRKLHATPYTFHSLGLSDDAVLDAVQGFGFDGVEVGRVLTKEYADAIGFIYL